MMKYFLMLMAFAFTTIMKCSGVDYEACKNLMDVLTPQERKTLIDSFNFKRINATSGTKSELPTACPGTMSALKWDEQMVNDSRRTLFYLVRTHLACPRSENGKTNRRNSRSDGTEDHSKFDFFGGHIKAYIASVKKTPSNPLVKTIQTCFTPLEGMPEQSKEDVIKSYRSGVWHCATQVLWADTKLFGCSKVAFHLDDVSVLNKIFPGNISGPWFITYILCAFKPFGNMWEKPVYPVCKEVDVSTTTVSPVTPGRRNDTTMTPMTPTMTPMTPTTGPVEPDRRETTVIPPTGPVKPDPEEIIIIPPEEDTINQSTTSSYQTTLPLVDPTTVLEINTAQITAIPNLLLLINLSIVVLSLSLNHLKTAPLKIRVQQKMHNYVEFNSA